MVYVIEPMRQEDIPEVTEIERVSFTTSWPVQAYRRELKDNRLARYIVARWVDPSHPNETARDGEDDQNPSAAIGRESSGLKRLLSSILTPWRTGEPTKAAIRNAPQLGGYAGLWLMVDEAHITTIAVRPHLRGRGLGELLMVALADRAIAAGADRMTLEVRASNFEAQAVYRKFGFKEEGVRRRYYSDNNEDALIMWSEPLASPCFTKRLAAIREHTQQKMSRHPLPPPALRPAADS